jgi:endonuclease-3
MSVDRAGQYEAVFAALNDCYGTPEWVPGEDPVDALVGTILSQSTADTNTARAFARLKARYPDWESVIDAPVADLVETIRVAGLANQKAPRIQDALRTIRQERGSISLDFLAGMPPREAEAWLTRIHGVGRKTAGIVLLFSLGMPAFPVDTHVHRVSGRLGLIPPRANPDRAMDILEALGAPETYYPFHINLIRHGRAVCKAPRPLCERCPVQDLCDYYRATAGVSHSAGV